MSASGLSSRDAIARPNGITAVPSFRIGELAAYAAYVGLLVVALRWWEGPPLNFDDGYFLLVSYSWINGLGFDNPWVNPIGSHIFNWHGFLQPMLVSWLSPCGTLSCLNIAVISAGVVYLAIWYWLVQSMALRPAMRWALYAIGVGCVLQYSARPELVASLLLAILTAHLYFRATDAHPAPRAIAAGVLVALIAVTSPILGVFAALGVAATTVFLRRGDRGYAGFVAEGSLCVAAMLATLGILLFVLYPHAPLAWIEGIRQHSLKTSLRADTQGFLKAYALNRLLPLQIVMLAMLAAVTIYALKEIGKAGSKVFLALFALCCVCASVLLYYTAIRIPLTIYNFTALVPSLAIVLALLATEGRSPASRYPRAIWTAPVVVLALATLLGQVVWATQTAFFLRDRRALKDEIARSVNDYLAQNRSIAMDSPLMSAIDDIGTLRKVSVLFFGQPHKDNQDPPKVDVLLRSQNEFPVLPDAVPGFKLVTDRYDPSPIARALRPKGTYYAIYEAVPR